MADTKAQELWRTYELGELADKIEGGGTPSRENPEYWNGGIPWASVKDLRGMKLSTTEEYISELGLQNSSSKLIPANTMIIASRMAVGKAAFFNRSVAINQDLKAFYPKANTDGLFLLQWYLSQSEKIESLATGSTVKGIRLEDLKLLPIKLPPLPEQQKIATILTSVDTVIEKTRAQIDKLKHLKTGMMQQLLTEGIGHTEFKDSPVGRIPKAWRVVQFKDVFTLNYGKSPKDIIAENGANTVWGTGGETAKTNNFLYEGESIVLGRKGTIDQPRYVTGKFWVIDTAYYSSNHGENNVRFLHYALQIKNLRALNEASGVPSLSRDTLYAEWLALPDPVEQQAIAETLYAIEVKIAVTNKKLSSFEKNKKALMQDLLSGKVRTA